MSVRPVYRWGLLWHQKNRLDGERQSIICERGFPLMFGTREDARKHAVKAYGHIKHRHDLRAEPHGWRMPTPVRVAIAPASAANKLKTEAER